MYIGWDDRHGNENSNEDGNVYYQKICSMTSLSTYICHFHAKKTNAITHPLAKITYALEINQSSTDTNPHA